MADPTCTVDGCDKPRRYVAGWCPMHYQRMKSHGTTDAPGPKIRALCECGEPVRCKGLCKSCYRRACYLRRKAEENASAAAYYAAHKEEILERGARWRVENPKASTAYYRKHRDAQLEAKRRWDANNPGKAREYGRASRKRNPDKWAMRNRENQRRRRRVDGKPVDFAAILAEHGMFCHICSMVIFDMTQLHFDHVIPLAKGGLHVAENIKPAHAVCNLRKGAKMPV